MAFTCFLNKSKVKGFVKGSCDHLAGWEITEHDLIFLVPHEVVFDLNVFCTSVELGVFGVVYSGHVITVQCDRIICMWNYLQAYQQALEPYSLLYRCRRSNVLSLHRRQSDHLLLVASPGDCSPI